MRHPLVSALALALLGACSQPAPDPQSAPAPERIEPFDLNIEIGRYGAMLNQIEEHGLAAPSAMPEPDVSDRRELARHLRETVWEYNIARSRLCARGVQSALACGPAYAPLWIGDAADVEVPLPELKARADALGEDVMRLWNAVCEEAEARVADEDERRLVCPME